MEVYKFDLQSNMKTIENLFTVANLSLERLLDGRKTSSVELRDSLSKIAKETRIMRKNVQLLVNNMPKRAERKAGIILDEEAGEKMRQYEGSDIVSRKDLGKWF
jgi:hypothetical protein